MADAVAAAAPAAPPVVTPQQAIDKIDAKAKSDTTVAADPHAVHHVKLLASSPKAWGSTAAGAGIGFIFGGPPGALIGAVIGHVVERYQIAGGPIGKIWDKIKPAAKAA